MPEQPLVEDALQPADTHQRVMRHAQRAQPCRAVGRDRAQRARDRRGELREAVHVRVVAKAQVRAWRQRGLAPQSLAAPQPGEDEIRAPGHLRRVALPVDRQAQPQPQRPPQARLHDGGDHDDAAARARRAPEAQ